MPPFALPAWPPAPLGELQALDDAIAYRAACLAQPCDGCQPGRRCHDHDGDEQLIADYQQRHAAAMTGYLARFDPADVSAHLREMDGVPPTVQAMTLAWRTRLRAITAAQVAGQPVALSPADRYLIGQLSDDPGTGDP